MGLADALSLCLLLVDGRPERYEAAALRWHGRYCRETQDVTLDEAQAVLALLGALDGPRRASAARALADLFDRRELLQASEALIPVGVNDAQLAEQLRVEPVELDTQRTRIGLA